MTKNWSWPQSDRFVPFGDTVWHRFSLYFPTPRNSYFATGIMRFCLLYTASHCGIKSPSTNRVFPRHLLFEILCWFYQNMIGFRTPSKSSGRQHRIQNLPSGAKLLSWGPSNLSFIITCSRPGSPRLLGYLPCTCLTVLGSLWPLSTNFGFHLI